MSGREWRFTLPKTTAMNAEARSRYAIAERLEALVEQGDENAARDNSCLNEGCETWGIYCAEHAAPSPPAATLSEGEREGVEFCRRALPETTRDLLAIIDRLTHGGGS